jgi:hypothetical protein
LLVEQHVPHFAHEGANRKFITVPEDDIIDFPTAGILTKITKT